MQKAFILINILFTCLISTAQPPYSKQIQDEITQVENNLAANIIIDGKRANILDRMASREVVGLSIAIIRNYEMVWAKGYGWADRAEKRPVTTTTLFEPGSISKSLNAMAILKMAQDNQIDLNTDINSYLKTWKFPYDSLSKGKKITIANLLSHTAGLGVHGFPGYDRKGPVPTLTEVLDGKKPANTPAIRSIFEPELKFQYSGGGTTISQLIAMDVSGEKYDKLLFEKVFKPLGMTNSFYTQPPAPDKAKDLASGYMFGAYPWENKYHIYPEQAAAGLWTTPTDLCKYIIETQKAYQGRSARVLDQKMTQYRLTPFLDSSSAMGIFIVNRNGTKYFTHSAANAGFCGIFYGSMEDGNGLVIFANSDEGAIFNELINSVAYVYKWKGFVQPATVSTVKVSDDIIRKSIGVYYDGESLAEISKEKDGLHYWYQGNSGKISFTSDTSFVTPEYNGVRTFIKDASGKYSGFKSIFANKITLNAGRVSSVDTLKSNSWDMNAYAWHLVQEKRYTDAIPFLERAMALDKTNYAIPMNLGHAHLLLNHLDEAIKYYKVCFEYTPGAKVEARATLAHDLNYLEEVGRNKKLLNDARKALKL